jgi:diguanylate cyclase (GGDEF)-like protein
MSANMLQALPAQGSGKGHASDRARARLDAYRLVLQVQIRDCGSEVADGIALAEARGWPEVVRILLYVDLVRAWVGAPEERDGTIQRLHDRAALDGDMVLLASALASRAEYQYVLASASAREQANRDLARAVALLEVAEGGALERATAYIDCGLAYSQRELWELEDEMYARANALLPECEEPLLDRALSLNWTVHHVNAACSLREMGEHNELRQLRLRLADRVEPSAESVHMDGFAVEERVARHLLARLVGDQPVEESVTIDEALTTERHPCEGPEHGMLRLADALQAAEEADWDEVMAQTATAVLLFDGDVGPPVIAMTLRLATQADIAKGSAGAVSAMAYGDWSARRRWDARLQLLAAARALLEAEQLRVERDEHAHQAHVDELTGLANRRGYTRHVERMRAHDGQAQMSVLVVDIDSFKAVNDTFGHAVGDAVLVQVAGVLSSGIRPADLVARLGGDEFVVLLDRMDAKAAKRRAAEMMQNLAFVDWSDLAADLDVTISIGVAAGFSNDPQPFLVRADEALYRSKSRGGGGITLADD